MDDRLQATLEGIADAFAGIPPDALVEALSFLWEYAKTHEYFNGGDVLRAYRDAKLPESSRNWRNKWGSLVSYCGRAGWMVKVGRVEPTTRQSHTKTLVQWKSMIYEGKRQPRETGVVYLNHLRSQVVAGSLPLMDALWKAYERGAERR